MRRRGIDLLERGLFRVVQVALAKLVADPDDLERRQEPGQAIPRSSA
jgi:hypothetical protein